MSNDTTNHINSLSHVTVDIEPNVTYNIQAQR